MNSKNLQSKIGKAVLALSLLFGIVIVSGMTAQAQYPQYPYPYPRQDDRYSNRGGYGYDVYRIAREQGFRDGVSAGEYDVTRGHRFEPERAHDYRKATNGYDRHYGNKDAYKDAYRQAFLRGYNDGFRRYNGNGRRGGYGRFPYLP